jgi:hypothetical protein
MGEISWADRVKYEDVLHRGKEERNIVTNKNASWMDTSWVGTAF